MIKTPLSTMIGGAFWTPNATILGGTSKTFNQLIKSLFAGGEDGFFCDPNDLTMMFQDAAGTVPVTGVGKPVGLMLDKSKGLVVGSEQVTDSAPFTLVGAAIKIIGNKLVAGKTYKLTFTVSGYSGTGDIGIDGTIFAASSSTRASGNGVISGYALCISGANNLNFFTRSKNQATFSNISVKELAGNHAYQTTSSMRPLLVASPQRLDYDTADDKLITNLPAQLTGCTVVRAVPNVGTQILTNQTIPATYNDNTDHCGLIVINRALTPSETSAITAEFDKRAGV